MNENFTIPAFTHRIADLPDQPNLSPSELKARFDACPEELRVAHNALAKCVAGITDATYPDTVTEAMLAEAVREKLDGKAEQAALESEVSARESADSALSTRMDNTDTTIAKKCEVYVGSYTGNGADGGQTITLGFRPRAVVVSSRTWNGNSYEPQMVVMALPGAETNNVKFTATGFTVKDHFNSTTYAENPYRYIAFQ